jgi:hypothetical protein
MKRKQTELDVDFIGGVRTLTKEDEKAISDYIKKNKLASKHKTKNKKSQTIKRSRVKI